MKGFKSFIKKELPSLKTVDFRDVLKAIQTVDFRDKKNLKENTEYPEDDDTKLLHDHLSKNKKKPDLETRNSIREYTRESANLNKHLHQYQTPRSYDTDMIDHLDKHLSSDPAPSDFHVYSGLHRKPEPGTYIHHGYISSSLNKNVAHDFGAFHLDRSENTLKHHILKLHIKKGDTHGSYIAPHAGGESYDYSSEREYLIGRRKKIKIHPNPEITEKDEGGLKHIHHIWHGEIVD